MICLPFRHSLSKCSVFICQKAFWIKKGHALSDTARCLKNLEKKNPPQISICEGLFFSAYQFYHLHIFIVIPLTCQCSASSLPIYFHFSSSLFICISSIFASTFSVLVNAQSIVAYKRIAFFRFL